MEAFTLHLDDGSLVTGLKNNVPVNVSHTQKGSPLIVCLHGSSYCAKYFDAHPAYSIQRIAGPCALPVVSINRPGYLGTPDLPKSKNEGDDTHFQNEARWLHNFVLPALWREYGLPSGATSIVILSHSLGSTTSLVTASYACTSNTSKYPLAGLVMSGLGTNVIFKADPTALEFGPPFDENGAPVYWDWVLDRKTDIMMNAHLGQAPPEAIAAHGDICTRGLNSEYLDSANPQNWSRYWRALAEEITVPIMYSLGDGDALWEGTQERVDEFASAFKKAPWKETGLYKHAPHSLELSWYGPAWYAKVVGFAMTCAIERALEHR